MGVRTPAGETAVYVIPALLDYDPLVCKIVRVS